MKKKSKTSKLEKKKIELEIALLEKPWWKKSEYLRIIIPIFFGIVSLIYAFSSGLIDKQKMDLQLTKKQLQYDIQKFNDKKDSLNRINDKLEKNITNIKYDNENLLAITDSLKKFIQLRSEDLNSLNKEMLKKKQIEYTLTCDLHLNKIRNNLMSINGTLWYDGLQHYMKLIEEYYKTQEYKDYKKEINLRTELTEIERIELAFDFDYSKTKHFKKSRERHIKFLSDLRDSLFNKMVKKDLNKCKGYFSIGSQTPKEPYIERFIFEREYNSEIEMPMILSDSISLYIQKK